MEKVETVIKDALTELVVQAVEAPIQPAQAQIAIRYLNRMMTAWDAQGIQIGYTVVSNLGDDVTVPDGALEGIVCNLAIRLAKQYDKVVPIDLAERAKEGYSTLLDLSVEIGPSFYPDTLSVGSGNEDDVNYLNIFYPDQEPAILGESGGFISIESETDI